MTGGLLSWMFGILVVAWIPLFRVWSATLAFRVRLVIARLVLIVALPLDFNGRLRVVRSMFFPGASRGIEASSLADASLHKLRTAIF